MLAASRAVPTGAIEQWVEVWQSRAHILSQPRPPDVSVVLAEQALAPPSADRPLTVQQRRHLADRATWPRIQVRILPAVAGQPAHIADQFTIMELHGRDPVVHVYPECTDRLVTEPDAVSQYTGRFARLADAALDMDASRKFLSQDCRLVS